MITKPLRLNISLLVILFSGLLLITCNKDDEEEATPTPVAPTDISGKYKGFIAYTEISDGITDKGIFDTIEVNVTGSGSVFTLTIDGFATGNGTIEVKVSGKTFSGSTGTGFFETDDVTGELNDSTLTFTYSGEDSDGTWTGDFTGKYTSGGNNEGPCGDGSGDFGGVKLPIIHSPLVETCFCGGKKVYGINYYNGWLSTGWFSDGTRNARKINIITGDPSSEPSGNYEAREINGNPMGGFGAALLSVGQCFVELEPHPDEYDVPGRDWYYAKGGQVIFTPNADGTTEVSISNMTVYRASSDFDGVENKKVVISAKWTCTDNP